MRRGKGTSMSFDNVFSLSFLFGLLLSRFFSCFFISCAEANLRVSL